MFERIAKVVSVVTQRNLVPNTRIEILVNGGGGGVSDAERDAIEHCAKQVLNGYVVVLSKHTDENVTAAEAVKFKLDYERLKEVHDKQTVELFNTKNELKKLQDAVDKFRNSHLNLLQLSTEHKEKRQQWKNSRGIK